MNLMKSISEIGVLEVERVAAMFPNNKHEIDAYLPPVDKDFVESRIHALADAVVRLEKSTLFLMTPEIALIEQLARLGWKGTALVALPFDMDKESVSRIRTNVPQGIKVQFVSEGMFPTDFRPKNGAIVCAGLTPSGYRYYIPPFSYRMMMQYKAFHGERVLLSCSPDESRVPEIGWTYAEDDFFTRSIPA